MKSAAELLDAHLRFLETVRNLTFQSIAHNRSVLTRWISFCEERGQPQVQHAQPPDVLAWIEQRSQQDHVHERTIAHELCILRTFYAFLVGYGGTTDPTCCLPAFICKPSTEQPYLSVAQSFALLDTQDPSDPVGARNYLIIALLWCMGLRSNELLALRWADIDLEQGTLLVRNGKGKKQRQLYFNDRLLDQMRHYRSTILGADTMPVFCTFPARRRRPLSDAALSQKELVQIVADAAQAANITEKVTPMTLRHTFATHMFEAGVPVRDIQEMMGHSEESETTIYIHVTIDAAKRLLNSNTRRTLYSEDERS